jgi:hypothetical protein
MWAKAIQNKSIFDLINSASIIVNDGNRDLTISEATRHINKLQEQDFNFSYNNVNIEVTINDGQQMVVHETMEVTNTLTLEGQVVII